MASGEAVLDSGLRLMAPDGEGGPTGEYRTGDELVESKGEFAAGEGVCPRVWDRAGLDTATTVAVCRVATLPVPVAS